MQLTDPACKTVDEATLPRELFGYEVIDFIGEGAGSAIYVVAAPETRQLYAMKYVRRRREKDQRYFEQLENEFTVSRDFTHPVLRRSIALREDRSLFRKPTEAALVMELVDGQGLDSVHNPPLPVLLDAFIQAAQGLRALHAMGLAHCDLKPGNIMLCEGGGVKIIDFGQACRLGSVKERIQGTPDFIAPEQVRCDPVTRRTDVFNLGATIYWALTRRAIPTLYTLKKDDNSFLVDERILTPHDINHAVPEPLSNLIMECVRTNPARRPADMNELADRLETVKYAVCRQTIAVA